MTAVLMQLIFIFFVCVGLCAKGDGSKRRKGAGEKQKEQSLKDHKEKMSAFLTRKWVNEKCALEGVVRTASGLCYKKLSSLNKSDSEAVVAPKYPTDDDEVTVHYTGAVGQTGKQFDSSYERNQPASFKVTEVIEGWTEGLKLMEVGDKFEFFIPPELAYGERGAGRDIPKNAALYFIVELLQIVEKRNEAEELK